MTSPSVATPRVALVTGTSSGIGAAVVKHFCELGHQVLAVDFNPAGKAIAEQAGAAFLKLTSPTLMLAVRRWPMPSNALVVSIYWLIMLVFNMLLPSRRFPKKNGGRLWI